MSTKLYLGDAQTFVLKKALNLLIEGYHPKSQKKLAQSILAKVDKDK